MTRDSRGNWRGMPPQGWHKALENDTPSLSAPQSPASDTEASCPPPIVIPKLGVPIALPTNNYPPITAQTLGLVVTKTIPNGTTQNILSFTVPQNYNGWILSTVYGSQNNAATPGLSTFTSFQPFLNNQRIWPFIFSESNIGFFARSGIIIPTSFSDLYSSPLQLVSGNVITVNATNASGADDVIVCKILGWIDQNYVPNQAADRSG